MNPETPVVRYLYQGKQLSIYQIARCVKINSETLRARLARGMTIDQAIAAKPMTASQAGQQAKKKSPWRTGIK